MECTVDDSWARGKARAAIYLGDGNDTLNTYGGKGVVAHGQGGDDLLEGSYGFFENGGGWSTVDRLYGEAGDDVVEHGYCSYGGDGSDSLENDLNYDGGNGTDTVSGGSGANTIRG